MELTIEGIAALSVDRVRRYLAAWVAAHLECDEATRDGLRARLQAVLDAATEAELDALRAAFLDAGSGWRLFRADPLAQRITRTYMAAAASPREVVGAEHLEQFLATPGRKLVVCNHLSYTDTQVTDVVLAQAGLGAAADRLVAIAGPKVYTEAWRRMASIALNTRKTAQSNVLATEQDALTPRELAAIALETLADCGRLMDEGLVVLLYPEGRRSRDGRLQPFLRAAARYLAIEGVRVLPMAQTGGDTIFPVDAAVMRPGAARIVFGEAFSPKDHPGKTGAVAEAHRRVAALLPPEHRPLDGNAAVG